jgi:hypothetical protein
MGFKYSTLGWVEVYIYTREGTTFLFQIEGGVEGGVEEGVFLLRRWCSSV